MTPSTKEVATVVVKGNLVVVPKRQPKKTSDRKRPNKAFIEKSIAFRGFMTGNESTLLEGLKVKNSLQRVNNLGMADDVTKQFTGAENTEIQKAMKEFVSKINKVLKMKKGS